MWGDKANQETLDLTEEQHKTINTANALDALLRTPGWRWINAAIDKQLEYAQSAALAASSDADVLAKTREWQHMTKTFAGLLNDINAVLDSRNALIGDPQSIQAAYIEEQLNGRDTGTESIS